MADDVVVGDGNAQVHAGSRARFTDEMTAVLSGPDRTPLRGPDPAEWPEEQFVPPPDIAAVSGDYEIRGPDPEKWPAERFTPSGPAPETIVDEQTTAATVTDSVTVESGDVADAGVVLGTVDPPA